MREKSIEQLGALQRAVMEIVWNRKECSVHQVIEYLPQDKKPAYTTILAVMQKLEKSGWLEHRQDGRAYIYHAVQTREQWGSRSISQTIRQMFKGDLRSFMQHLIADESLSDEDLMELRRTIDKHRRK